MRLGFDLDGTLADMQNALAREARRLFPDVDLDSLPRSAAPDSSAEENANGGGEDTQWSMGSLNSAQQREIWKAVAARHNFWETLDEIEPGALARLWHLVQTRKWELIFLTSRPETVGDTAQAQSYRWLAAHGYAAPSIF